MQEEFVKIAILEQKITDLKDVVVKIDDAIEKLSEVNINVGKILAVHEQKITKQEDADEILFAKIDKLRDKMDSDHHKVLSRIQEIEKRVWIGVGIVAAFSFFINHTNFWNKLLTPATVPAIIQESNRT
jgi:predicted  nucleic acid-binding Zn-ribbon protein